MKRTAGHWIARIGLGILGVLVALGIILYLLNPEVATLAALALLQPLLSNTHPPPILSGVKPTVGWGNWDETNREVTAALQQKFAIGTNEASVKAILLRQGFKPRRLPAPIACRRARRRQAREFSIDARLTTPTEFFSTSGATSRANLPSR
jgi:hypothetical protein